MAIFPFNLHKMIKGYLKKTIACAALAIIPVCAPAFASVDSIPAKAVSEGNQIELKADYVPSGEINEIQESDIARRMTQAEKAENARVNDQYGGAITIIAMCIVIGCLVVLSLLFLGFGAVSTSLQKARKRRAHGVDEHTMEDHHEELDTPETIAAISMALAEHTGHGHDMETTILTLKRMKKAYSPWNSKIYNMRVLPPVAHSDHSK